jgi:sulfide:quinone oxidoreductase
MKKLVILGAGTAGTIMANHLDKKLNKKEWSITIIDQFEKHYYQPGFLFIPFGIYTEKDVTKDKIKFLPKDVEYIKSKIEIIQPEVSKVKLADGMEIGYDILIIATGSKIAPEEIDGLSGVGWRKNIFEFYTINGALALQEKLKKWEGGKLVVHLAEMPIKCPVAPLEFTFLAEWWFRKNGKRKDVDITFVTPLSGAFTKKKASDALGHLLKDKNINVVHDFAIKSVDPVNNILLSYDEQKVGYDLLITIPTNMGDDVIERSGLGDELNFVPTDKHTLQSKENENIFVIGDATDLPSSKAGSVAHFQAEVLTKNIINYINDKPLLPDFDGHANCFIETGNKKALLIDFNYDIEPAGGKFPVPGIGPLTLLRETRINHVGKMVFKWIYWNILLKAIRIPGVPAKMSKLGKKLS